MTFNLDNSCYGKLKLSYNEKDNYYSVDGENRGVTFKLNSEYNLFFADSVYSGKIYIGKVDSVSLENQTITLDTGITINLDKCDYFGRGY